MSKLIKNTGFVAVALLLTLVACTKPYNPPAITAVTNYLVVEGVINPGSDSTVIKLSHTISLANAVTEAPELNATVTIESNQNNTYPLITTGRGRYVSAPLNASNSNQYRLRVLRSNGETYLSDFVQVKNAAPIDTISYAVQNNNVNITLATHDPTNNSRYYRWDYNETYEFNTFFKANYAHIKDPEDTIVPAIGANEIYICWHTDTGTNILLNSSAKLSQDIITNQPIASLPDNGQQFEYLFSIQVNQYALTPDAFNYWQQLKTNTQQLGSIFDAQPTMLTGNIHCITKPAETVLGYISAGIPSHKRIFISTANLPAVTYVTPYGGCPATLLSPNSFFYADGGVAGFFYTDQYTPMTAITQGSIIIGYVASPSFCADCRYSGTNKKPSFWP